MLTVSRTGKGKHYRAGKQLLSPDQGGDTIEQEIEAGGKLGAVYVICFVQSVSYKFDIEY